MEIQKWVNYLRIIFMIITHVYRQLKHWLRRTNNIIKLNINLSKCFWKLKLLQEVKQNRRTAAAIFESVRMRTIQRAVAEILMLLSLHSFSHSYWYFGRKRLFGFWHFISLSAIIPVNLKFVIRVCIASECNTVSVAISPLNFIQFSHFDFRNINSFIKSSYSVVQQFLLISVKFAKSISLYPN